MRKLIILPDNLSQNSNSIRLSPLITHQGLYLFPHIFNWLPALANELVTELIECGDNTKVLIGAWLIFCESFRNDAYITGADQLAVVSPDHRTLLASVTSESLCWTGNRHRAVALLKEFFFDEDEQIRKLAADAFRNIPRTDVEKYRELTAAFLKSPALSGNSYAVLDMLKNATCDVLDLVIAVSERLVRDAGQDSMLQYLPANSITIDLKISIIHILFNNAYCHSKTRKNDAESGKSWPLFLHFSMGRSLILIDKLTFTFQILA